MISPNKKPRENRTASIRTGLTLAEKAYIQQQAAEAGISDAEYLRRRALNYAVPCRTAKQSQAAFVNEINRLGNQLAALGNIVNQVALYCHTDRRIPAEWDCLPSEINELKHRVEETLERILIDGS